MKPIAFQSHYAKITKAEYRAGNFNVAQYEDIILQLKEKLRKKLDALKASYINSELSKEDFEAKVKKEQDAYRGSLC